MPDDTRSVFDHLIEALRDLNDLVRRERLPTTIIGGVAASLLGRPRLTKDIDLLVRLDEQEWAAFLQAAQSAGFATRGENPLLFAQQNRVLLLRHQSSAVDIDVIFGATSFEDEIIRRSSIVQVHGLSLPLPTPEDLVAMKWLAHRPQDLLDVEGLFDACPSLNVASVRGALGEFAEFIDDFDLLGEFDAMLARRNKTR